MIKLLGQGEYSLIETKGQIKIVSLDKSEFVWISAEEIGEILVITHRKHWVDHILAVGKYRIYDVKNEKNLVDMTHLELLVGKGLWQGYLLPTGLPSEFKKKCRVIPTREIITKSNF